MVGGCLKGSSRSVHCQPSSMTTQRGGVPSALRLLTAWVRAACFQAQNILDAAQHAYTSVARCALISKGRQKKQCYDGCWLGVTTRWSAAHT